MIEDNNIADMESLEQCKSNYCKPVKKLICCEDFGKSNGMNGSCHWCREMTPYQWHMCSDESWKQTLMKKQPFGKNLSGKEAIEFIQNYKQIK